MNEYLTTTPVSLRAGYLRKTSDRTDNEEQDRQANLAYSWLGIHGEKQWDDNIRFTGDMMRERFDMREGGVPNLSATTFKLGAMYMGHPTMSARGEIGYRWFGSKKRWWDNDGDNHKVKDQFLYDIRGDLLEVGGMALNLGAYSRRREHYDNWQNAYSNLYAYDFGIDGHYRVKKWDFLGFMQGTVLSDSNSRYNINATAKYRLVETPKTLIMVGGNVEYEDWQYTKPEYFSPQSYYKYGLDLDMRYYICRDPELWNGCETYVDFGLSVFRDRFSSMGQKFFVGVHHDYNRRLSLYARADYNKESYYDEVKLYDGIDYKFGGCK